MIAGIDPSTASLGLAHTGGRLETITPHAGPKEKDRRLNELESAVIRRLRMAPPLPRLVVIEGPAHHSIGIMSTIAVAEVRAVIRLALWRYEVPTLEISPSALKRYATGNGNASKDAMVGAALARGGHPRNDDEADAFHLRHLGRAAYGLETNLTPTMIEVLASTTWPTIEGPT